MTYTPVYPLDVDRTPGESGHDGDHDQIHTKLNAYIDIAADFGAACDYDPATDTGTDDTAKVNDAIAKAKDTGRTLYVPGHCKVTAPLEFTDFASLSVRGPRSGVQGGVGNMRGAWFHYTGGDHVPIAVFDGCQNVDWEGVGFHSVGNVADGIHVVSDNDPPATQFSFRNFDMYQLQVAGLLNGSGGSTQSDQMVFQMLALYEIYDACFRTYSDNVTGVLWQRVATSMIPDGPGIHYDFLRGGLLKLDMCNGGFGEDYVRVAQPVARVSLYESQCESQTEAFLRLGQTSDAGNTDTTIMQGCSPDGRVLVLGPSRKLVSIGNLWHAGSTLELQGDNTRVTSLQEDVSLATVSVSGINSQLRRLDHDGYGAPATGDHHEGEVEWETLPYTTGYLGRVCVSSGTPGIWKSFGNLRAGGIPPTLVANEGTTGESVDGNMFCGQITLTTAAGIFADTSILSVVFPTALDVAPTFILQPADTDAAAAQAWVGSAATQCDIALHNPPAAATEMKWNYLILQ